MRMQNTGFTSENETVVGVVPVNTPFTMAFRGTHVMADLYGVPFETLNEQSIIAGVLENAIPKGGATLLGIQLKKFDPHGVTALALLSESHVSIHTYPEKGSAFLDVFTCGDCDPDAIAREIANELGAEVKDLTRVDRGDQASVEAPVLMATSENVVEEIAPGIARHWHVEEVVAHARTQYQDVLIGRTAQGLTLFCEGERQSSELSQLIYHEGQIIPAALMAENIGRVLIIGSSEGVISQIAVDMGAEQVTHVDIDEACVRLCAEFLPYGYSPEELEKALRGEGPVRVLFEDAYAYVDRCANGAGKFDIIVMDLPDEQIEEAQQNRLYQEEFMTKIASLLSPDGAFITQAGSTTYWRHETLIRTLRRMNRVFPTTAFFEMEEQDWAWAVGCTYECNDVVKRMTQRLSELRYRPQFIDAQSIQKATIIPASIRRKLSE